MHKFPSTICPDQARELLLDYLTPIIENGTVDELYRQFIANLAPLAAAAAQRALRNNLAVRDPELILAQVRQVFQKLLDTFEGIALNPDMLAVSHDSFADIAECTIVLRDWLFFFDNRDPASPEATVHPTAAAIMEAGGVQ